MYQLSFNTIPINKTVNVASVKHRSPFRYPGGKTWLVPRIFQWLNKPEKPSLYIEPFAGGAIVGLSVAFENLAEHVLLVEIDNQVASVWQTIITEGEGEWLAQRIEDFHLTSQAVSDILCMETNTTRDKAFQTILQNRVSHGGILAKGAGLVKNGENGKGINSRWYPQTLAKRIRDIHKIRDRFTFLQGDAFNTIEQYKDRTDVVFFLDPPYTAGNGKRAGSRLYNHFEVDHEHLFDLMSEIKADFLLTYDNDDYVRNTAERHGFDTMPIAMQNTHLNKMTELVIGKNLDRLKP